jgi:predicted RNA-binding Zn-ribbon protein involved in translation (DUF1610 family)
MPDNEPPVKWAPRISPTKIRKLYQTDALRIVDEELIDEVGFALYSRSRSTLTVTEAAAGRVACPKCEALIIRQSEDPAELLRCATCGWETTWERYHQTWRHQELYGGGGVDAFQDFVKRWPRASTPQQKMLLIDQLIHTWHWQACEDHLLGRPTAVNLIEGSRAQAVALLDELTYGPNSAEAMRVTDAAWRANWEQVREGQRRASAKDGMPET